MMTEQEKYIRIKKSKFEEEKNTDSYKRVQRMAKTLSSDLYESESHFIYELIQNAQDNSYSADVIPEISFYLLDNGILIQNNEVGFDQNNIDSICDFHESTKTKNKELGYIGEKGIGFKSVFTISDTPSIHSNGYRFFFKKGEYIEPYWIDNLQLYPENFADQDYTSIYLPYSDDFKHIDDIKSKIKDIEPFVLLFLDKLKKISIFDQNRIVLDVTKEINQKENTNELILKSTKTNFNFITINKVIRKPENLIVSKREKIKDREIIFAFPLSEIQDDRVFAFLPTHVQSGLPFIIQADFLLTANRENILFIDEAKEWNNWLICELQSLYESAITNFQNHESLKYTYLRYYKKNNNGNNQIFNALYETTIKNIRTKNIILNDQNLWEKPENILILDGIQFEIKMLKKLYGNNFSIIHPEFKIDKFLIDRFKIRKINRDGVTEKICRYLESEKNIHEGDLKVFTMFLADNSTDNLIQRIRKFLPILPFYKQTSKHYYLAIDIFLPDSYNPIFSIENMISDIDNKNFSTWNLLSNYYKSAETLKIFIKKILGDEQQKISSFFKKYPEILQEYLFKDIYNHYPKILDFLIESKIDEQTIKNLPLILTNQDQFKSVSNKTTEIYFSHIGSESIETLHPKLLNLLNENQRYKELFTRLYGIKIANDVTIILDKHLPWFERNRFLKNSENDQHILKLTQKILQHFDEFDDNQKKLLKNKMLFIATNSSDRYLKADSIYLFQNLQQSLYDSDSIEKFITADKKELFDFLDKNYEFIFEENDSDKVIKFLDLFSFAKSLRRQDTEAFIKSLKPDLSKEDNLKAIKAVVQNNPNTDALKIIKVYDHHERLEEIQNLYFQKIGDTDIAHLHDDYKKMNLEWGYIKQYFRESGKKAKDMNFIISYLKSDIIDLAEAENIFRYIDMEDLSNPSALQKLFKTDKLILDSENNRKYLDEVRWHRDKSSKTVLSEIYCHELERFFVKKLGLTDDVTIKSVIDELKTYDEKCFEYYELLLKLGYLSQEERQLQKYYHDAELNKHLSDDTPKSIKTFIVSNLRLFLLDNGRSNQDGNFYFNDLNLEDYDSKLSSKIFSLTEDAPPIKHFDALIDNLSINKLSDFPLKNHCGKFIDQYELSKYQQYVRFTYDYLYSEEKNRYDDIIANMDQFQPLNMIKTISIYDHLYTSRTIEQVAITDKSIESFIEVEQLNVTSEEGIFKFIGEKFGIAYEMIELFARKRERYRKEKQIKTDPHFFIEFADLPVEPKISIQNSNDAMTNDENYEYDQNESNTLRDAFDEHKGTGETEPFAHSKHQGSYTYDEEKYACLAQDERASNTNSFRNSQTNRKLQDRNEIEKVRSFLYREYDGHCQICGDTFAYNGKNHFEIGSMNIGRYRDVNVKGNTLCLCNKHQKIFEFALQKYTFYEDHLKKINHIEPSDFDNVFGKCFDFVGKEDINESEDAFYNLHDDDNFMLDDIRFLPIKIFGKIEYLKVTQAHELEIINELNRR